MTKHPLTKGGIFRLSVLIIIALLWVGMVVLSAHRQSAHRQSALRNTWEVFWTLLIVYWCIDIYYEGRYKKGFRLNIWTLLFRRPKDYGVIKSEELRYRAKKEWHNRWFGADLTFVWQHNDMVRIRAVQVFGPWFLVSASIYWPDKGYSPYPELIRILNDLKKPLPF